MRAECLRLGIASVSVQKGLARFEGLELRKSQEARLKRIAPRATVLPDAYFHRLPGNCTGTSLELRIVGGGRVTGASWGCVLGHEGPLSAPMTAGPRYYARACIKVSGGKFCGDSPEAWL